MRYANLLMAALFVFGAAVQLNDPDPLRWIAVYLAGAGACLLAYRRPEALALPALVALVCLAWAASLSPHVVGRVPFLEMFGAWEMKNLAVEESREMYGLLIIAGWMLVLSLRAFFLRRRPAAAPPSGRDR